MWKYSKLANNIVLKRKIHTNLNRASSFDFSEEVKHGLEAGAPVVALESTIITHGMPFPENMNCALEVENIVRQQGAIPATIAILGGRITVGLNYQQISYLADTNSNHSIKTSRRDFPYVISKQMNGGTTVSGTIIVAEKAGIPIFVTGGIGGVHREGEKTLDISADLTELGRSSITVVSAGVKSILDIPRTLEFLETQGVFVATFGDSTNFPAFYSRTSGCHAPYNVSSAKEAAEIIDSSFKLKLKSGMLFAVPVPETDALDEQLLQEAIDQALKDAQRQGVTGKNITPFLLSAVAKITKGRSLQTNIALIKNNAKVGAQIAVELSKTRSGNKIGSRTEGTFESLSESASPLVIGGSVFDCCASIQDSHLKVLNKWRHGSLTAVELTSYELVEAPSVSSVVLSVAYNIGATSSWLGLFEREQPFYVFILDPERVPFNPPLNAFLFYVLKKKHLVIYVQSKQKRSTHNNN